MGRAFSTFFAPCPRGLESVLSTELSSFGAQTVSPTEGGVEFSGPFDLCYRANLESRIASRILWRVGSGGYRNEHDLHACLSGLPWPEWFSVRRTIKIKVSARHCALKSLNFVTLRVKDAVCDRFMALAGRRPDVDTRRPDIRIDLFLDQQDFILYLDTTGAPLFMRGSRHAPVVAPIRENLAAGIIKLSGWTPDETLLDPMCGGGTILVEAAQMANNIAPGLGRRFAFEHFANFDRRRWVNACEESRAKQTLGAPVTVYGCDLEETVLKSAQANLKAAGLDHTVILKHIDVLHMKPPTREGILVTNPPYGVRTGRPHALAKFYPQLGDVLKQRFPSWRAYILSADMNLPRLIGLTASRRTPLFNGALECRLFEFNIVRRGMSASSKRSWVGECSEASAKTSPPCRIMPER